MTLLIYINTVVICILFIICTIQIFRLNELQFQFSELNYWVYKPLFPFVLAETDPYNIIIPHRD